MKKYQKLQIQLTYNVLHTESSIVNFNFKK